MNLAFFSFALNVYAVRTCLVSSTSSAGGFSTSDAGWKERSLSLCRKRHEDLHWLRSYSNAVDKPKISKSDPKRNLKSAPVRSASAVLSPCAAFRRVLTAGKTLHQKKPFRQLMSLYTLSTYYSPSLDEILHKHHAACSVSRDAKHEFPLGGVNVVKVVELIESLLKEHPQTEHPSVEGSKCCPNQHPLKKLDFGTSLLRRVSFRHTCKGWLLWMHRVRLRYVSRVLLCIDHKRRGFHPSRSSLRRASPPSTTCSRSKTQTTSTRRQTALCRTRGSFFAKDMLSVFKQLHDENPDLHVWFDVLCVNQHKVAAKEYDVDFFKTTFHSAIKEIGHTTVVLSPWNNPLPLARSWCLWEIYGCTLDKEIRTDVVIPRSEKDKFEQQFENNVRELTGMLSNIDIAKAEAWDKNDQKMILEACKSSPDGVGGIQESIVSLLRQWMVDTGRQLLENARQRRHAEGRPAAQQLGIVVARPRQVRGSRTHCIDDRWPSWRRFLVQNIQTHLAGLNSLASVVARPRQVRGSRTIVSTIVGH